MDCMTPEQRHRCMSRIRSKDTKPEQVVRQMLHALGFRFRLHAKRLPGKPDIVLPRHKKVIFVHGCFWHAHGCRVGGKKPATREQFWEAKFARNVARDNAAIRQLWQTGWQVLVVWECEALDPEKLYDTLTAFMTASAAVDYEDLAEQSSFYGMAAEASEPYLT
ncbi:MAG: very short patch repair endonuclease [Kiritimatiellaeota bacterium]|nr:very short patch repair endonuclease [Kiritimatiellota bacterium]